MLKQHSQLMISLLAIADALAVAVAWLLSYWLRFKLLPVDAAKGVPPLGDKYLPMLPLVALAHVVIFYRIGLYRPRRDRAILGEMRDIVKAFFVAIVAVVLIDYLLPQSNKISRQFVATYAVLGTTCFVLFRGTARVTLRFLRRRGWNRRSAAIIGAGRTAQRLLYALRQHSWTGIEVLYFVDDAQPRADRNADSKDGNKQDGARVQPAGDRFPKDDAPPRLRGVPVHGPFSRLKEIVEARPVDAIFVALPAQQAGRVNEVLAALSTSLADVRVVPEINPAYTMRPNVSTLDDVPILSLRQTPLYGWNAILKRGFDLVVGSICFLIALVPMAVISVFIKLGSPGPALYRQRRVGYDGREFEMLKFRTMRVDAEAGGAVWSRREDPRRTKLGAFLRRTSLDELPNLFNVLAGQMSLVGPRPERPEFIEKFKDEIPRYMLRHKMKAGMTGYAQIKGLRGDTSLRKRIQHDLHYIRHWSVWLDLRILLRTVFGVWFSKHEA